MRPRLPHAPPAWWQNLPAGMGTLSLLPNKDGGIIDDCIVTNAGDHLYMVINAGHEDKDLPHLAAHLADFVQSGKDASMETLPRNGLVAVQGPKAAEVLQRLVPDVELADMKFMAAASMTVNGVECFVTRSGYTGEDGFEIGRPSHHLGLGLALGEDGFEIDGLVRVRHAIPRASPTASYSPTSPRPPHRGRCSADPPPCCVRTRCAAGRGGCAQRGRAVGHPARPA